MNQGAGDLTIGVTATFDSDWSAALAVTHYFGSDTMPVPGYYGRSLSEWDKISASLQRSF
jgi:hypothetical protein